MRIARRMLFGVLLAATVLVVTGCNSGDGAESDYTYSCRYYNDMSNGDECVEYRGDWTLEEARQDCYEIYSFLDETTATVDTVPCDLGATCIGSCTIDRTGGTYIVTRYYEPVDAALLESFCVNPEFGNGTWIYGCEEGDGEKPANDPVEVEALDAMVSNDDVTVNPECVDADGACEQALAVAKQWIEFIPTANTPTTGFVIYPGATVDARAYAPPAQDMAKEGVLVVLVPAEGGLSLGVYDRMEAIMGAHPAITDWFLGGHSMGGAAATKYESESPGNLAGLILWAAYGSSEFDLSLASVPVMVIYGDTDGIATVEEVEEGKPYLPAATEYVLLAGANHAQFGYYGEQDGDGIATITKEQQQALVVESTLQALDSGK